MKICLNLSGQVRLRNGESLLNSIDEFHKLFNFDKLFMHLWLEDYLCYKDQIQQIQKKFNCSIVICDPPNFNDEILKLSNQLKHHLNFKTKGLLCQLYGIQSVFQRSCLEDFDIHIRCRFDNNFKSYFDLKAHQVLLSKEEPIAIFPYGADWCEGLPDVFFILNKSASGAIKNYFDDSLKLLELNYPLHPETLLRVIFINLNNCLVYRLPLSIEINSEGQKNQNFIYTKSDENSKFCILDQKKFIPFITNDEQKSWIENFENINETFYDKKFTNNQNLIVKKLDITNNQIHRLGWNYWQNNDKLDMNWVSENYNDPIWSPIKLDLELLKKQKSQIKNFQNNAKLFIDDLVFIIIVRIDSSYRLKNLKKVVGHLNRFFHNKIIICEHDNESKIDFEGNYEKKLIKINKKGFCRNYALNEIYKDLNYKYVLNIEADVILDPFGIEQCYNSLKDLNLVLSMPFNGFPIWLNDYHSNEFIKNNYLPEIWRHTMNLNSISDMDNEDWISKQNMGLEKRKHPGFSYLINLEKFKQIGGENENFYVFGFEDNERIYRTLKFGTAIFWADNFAYHLWHPRNRTNDWYGLDNIVSKEEYLRIINLNLDQLQNEVENWNGYLK